MNTVSLYVIRNAGEFIALDDDWTDAIENAAHFLSPIDARKYAGLDDEVVKVEYAEDWSVVSQGVVK